MTTSVVIACYNGEKYILEQLESIRNQTVSPDEVLLCDDSSTDNTFEIVEKYIKDNELTGWRIQKNETNKGWKATFANLVLQASKDILILCDQDDIWYPNKLETQVSALKAHNDVQLVVCDLDVKYMSENVHPYEPEIFGDEAYLRIALQPKWLRIMRPGCAFAVRREFAQTCFSKYWREGLAHDLFLWQCAFLAYSIGYIHEPLFAYRRFQESTTAGKITSKTGHRIVENEIFLQSLDAACGIYKEPQLCSAAAKKMAQRCIALETKRKRFFQTKNVFIWLSCLAQLDCYPFAKSWPADLYHTFVQH